MDKKTNNSNKASQLKFENNEKEEDFYRDLDKKTAHQSCCTCQTLVLFFIGLLLVLSGAIFFIYWQVSHGGVTRFNISPKTTVADFGGKLSNSNLDIKGQYSIVVSSDDLNMILNDGLSIQDFILKDATVSINPNNLLIYGNLVKPFSSKIVLTVVPKAANNKVIFTVDKITAGNINLPTILNQGVEKGLNDLVDKKMATFYQKADVKEVNLEDSAIIIKGEPKK